ncbi:MAG: GTPase domain-containing protein [Eubacteriales bacterium]|nr:GTPase domain-containing protein [Eubacteriales bacterium]
MSKLTFELLEWANSGNDLLDRSHRVLSNVPSDKIREMVKKIPPTILPPDAPVKVVFAGQYGAGKSTIMKVLTGRDDIATGPGITTQEAHTYNWNGVELVDTPGVHTKLRPDHDEISYRAIADADLLVFLVTNELFDSHLAQHFRKIAIERDKAPEMMLVVNKMRRCAMGNSQEAQAVIREDIRKVLAPFSPEELRTSFIDAESAIEGKNEKDEFIGKALWKKSGIELFILELNSFVREKGLSGRYTTTLYNLEQTLQEALSAESTGDTDVDALEELLLQRRRALLETQDRILRAVEGKMQQAGAQIRQEGRKVADLIHGTADQKQVDNQLQTSQDRVQIYSEQLGQSIQEVISEHMKDLDDRVAAILNSELAKELLPHLVHRIEDASISPEAMSKIKNASDISNRLGEFLIRNSFTAEAGTLSTLFNLNQYSGTAMHEAVLNIGHFFGKSFKPWEAVKWTRGIANAGRVLVVVGTVLTFALQIKEDSDAVQLESDLRESRSAIRSGFNDSAHLIEMHFDKATNAYIAKTLTPEIESVDRQLTELRDMQQSRSDLFQELLDLLKETRQLIQDIHKR